MIKHQRTKTLRYWCTDMKHPYTNFTIYQSNRSIATYALIDELDIGVVTNFLPDDAARGIMSPSSSSSASLGECSHMLLLRHLHEEWDPCVHAGILEKMKVVPESEWTQIDNRQVLNLLAVLALLVQKYKYWRCVAIRRELLGKTTRPTKRRSTWTTKCITTTMHHPHPSHSYCEKKKEPPKKLLLPRAKACHHASN